MNAVTEREVWIGMALDIEYIGQDEPTAIAIGRADDGEHELAG